MSEFWVSKKKYFCKYCDIYIADDVPSRQQHENGLRHKGNKERFVRSLYKTSEKRKHDLEEEKREMARVERAAQAAFAQDVDSGLAKPSSLSTSAPLPRSAPSDSKPAKPASTWSNYSTAESLGYTDPDVERSKAEAERRRTQGVAGDWEVVASNSTTPVEETAEGGSGEGGDAGVEKKREAEPVDEDDARAFKVRKKEWSGLGEVWDPESVPIKLKAKKKEADGAAASDSNGKSGVENGAGGSFIIASSGTSQATAVPKWTPRGWTKPGEASEKSAELSAKPVPPNDETLASINQHEVKLGLLSKPLPSTSTEAPMKVEEPAVKLEDSAAKLEDLSPAASTSMFKKRKVPTGTAGSRLKR